MSNPGELERVLREDDWLRRIARRLVGDAHVAEDLAQEAWVAALASGRADRPWLFGVLRNLRRASARRGAREEGLETATTPTARPTDEVVDELLLRKRVTDGLLELEEPYRTVLYLRYVQDLGLNAIARRSGVAVSTVHQRIARGLELLRKRLDAHYDGRRRAWALGLLSVAKSPGLAVSIGGLVMETGAKVVGAVLLLGGAMFWLWPSEERAEARPLPSTSLAEEAPRLVETELLAPGPTAERATVATTTSEPESPTPALAAELLHGRVVGLDGNPVAAVRVGYDVDAGSEEAATTDGLGFFVLPAPETGLDEGELRLVCLEPDFVTLVHGLRQDDRRLVVVGRSAAFGGVVEDPAGNPIAAAEVRFDLQQSLFREHGVVRPWSSREIERRTHTDDDGRFDLDALCGGEHVALWVVADGFQGRSVDLPASGDPSLRIVLEPSEGQRLLEGVVIDLRGAPVPAARVSAGNEIVRTDDEGAFRLPWRQEEAGDQAKGEDRVWRSTGDTSILRAVKVGHLPAEVAVAELVPGERIVLRLGGAPPSIRGRLVDEEGRPRAGVILWAGGLTPFGSEENVSGGAVAVWRLELEELLRGPSGPGGQATDEEGRFVLSGLLPKEYEVRAYDSATAAQGGPWRLFADDGEIELVLANEPGTERVAGRVFTASGAPLAGVWIVPRRSNGFNNDSQPPHLPDVVYGTHTDEEGRLEFPALATRGTILELQHDAFFIRHWALEGRGDLTNLEIEQPVLCELQIELQEHDFADALVLLGEDDKELEVLESWGSFLSFGESASFQEGKTSVLRVVETARTLTLRKEGQEVLRRPLHLDPNQRTDLRL